MGRWQLGGGGGTVAAAGTAGVWVGRSRSRPTVGPCFRRGDEGRRPMRNVPTGGG